MKTKIAVIFGGHSSEHDISILSAREVIQALDLGRYTIIPVYVTRAGEWSVTHSPVDDNNFAKSARPISLLLKPGPGQLLFLDGHVENEIIEFDLAFPLIHGPNGEDGTIQAACKLAQIPCVGSSVGSSAICMDKSVTKALLLAAGLPVTTYQVVRRVDWHKTPEKIFENIQDLGMPLFVKPANLGSSIGISKVKSREDFFPAMDHACHYDRIILIEKAVQNAREVEVAVLGNDFPKASVAGEILTSHEFYTYEAKYHDPELRIEIPAKISQDCLQRMQQAAIQAFQILQCAGFARVDFLLKRETEDFYISEINTIPGFTTVSMFPMLWQNAGISFRDLLTQLCDLALVYHQDISQNRVTR